MEYKSASKENEVLTHTTTWINPEDIMLSKKKKKIDKKGQTFYDPPSMRYLEKPHS